jgi:hypothetical protein
MINLIAAFTAIAESIESGFLKKDSLTQVTLRLVNSASTMRSVVARCRYVFFLLASILFDGHHEFPPLGWFAKRGSNAHAMWLCV